MKNEGMKYLCSKVDVISNIISINISGIYYYINYNRMWNR